ncbi:hypothetical protein C8R48DRAFT_837816 [Suillus tomentosus]|nr:hypothetical protein C8R48DRAFT_837816 [Suillus tomentosus]
MFGELNDLPVSSSLAIVPHDDLACDIVDHAKQDTSQLILLPWLPPCASIARTGEGATLRREKFDHNPFEVIFGPSRDKSASAIHSQFVRGVLAQSETDVALFVDPGNHLSTGAKTGGSYHIFLPFFDGPNDHLALEFMVQLCMNPKINATATVRFPDTVYGQTNTERHMQSETADSIIWSRYMGRNLSDPDIPGPLRPTFSWIDFTNLTSPVPLHAAIQRASMCQRVLVVTGRSKQLAVQDHRAELKDLVEVVGHEAMSKTIGGVATAFVASGPGVHASVTPRSLILRECPIAPQVKKSFSHTETVTTQPRTATPNEHFRVDVSARVFESEHHSQHYTSGVHTTPPLQHPPVTSQPASQQYILDVHPTPPLQHPPAPPQPVQDQPHKIWPIPAQVSSSTTRTIDEPPRQNLQKSPATSIDSTDSTARASAVHQPHALKTQTQAPTSGDIEWDVWPDGPITRIYSREDAKRPEVNDFHVHWACEGLGAPRKQHRGSLDALEWQEGVRTRRRCNGVIVCANHESKGGSCASKQIVNWLNCATYAHACTIVIAKRKKNRLQEMAKHILTERRSAALDVDSKSVPTPEEEANAILQAAWLDLQLSYDPSAMDVDVDLECLGILEQRMFELSLAAGAAGNEQWGKDAGTHQDRWNPYEGLPEHWNHGDRDPYAPEFEGELDVRHFHIRSGRLH